MNLYVVMMTVLPALYQHLLIITTRRASPFPPCRKTFTARHYFNLGGNYPGMSNHAMTAVFF